jgi:hypothetical protein
MGTLKPTERALSSPGSARTDEMKGSTTNRRARIATKRTVLGPHTPLRDTVLIGREASAEGSHATLRPGQTRTDLGSESIGEKRFKGDTEEQYEVDKRKRDVRKRND